MKMEPPPSVPPAEIATIQQVLMDLLDLINELEARVECLESTIPNWAARDHARDAADLRETILNLKGVQIR